MVFLFWFFCFRVGGGGEGRMKGLEFWVFFFPSRERASSLSLSLIFFSSLIFLSLSLTGGAHEGEVERVEEEHDVLALFFFRMFILWVEVGVEFFFFF